MVDVLTVDSAPEFARLLRMAEQHNDLLQAENERLRARVADLVAGNTDLVAERGRLRLRCEDLEKRLADLAPLWRERCARVVELEQLINTPHTGEFVESVRREAAHQIERWGTEHDAGKAPADWFWLVGYLLGKALHFPEKRKHHLVSSAAALLNWYRAETGDSTRMRPGIEPPASEVPEMLRTLSPEELAAVPPLTEEQIVAALETGRRDRDLAAGRPIAFRQQEASPARGIPYGIPYWEEFER
jgi:regulator of replication initiation timing